FYSRSHLAPPAPAQGRIRRRSSALLRTALTCGQTSMRACSSSLTTSLITPRRRYSPQLSSRRPTLAIAFAFGSVDSRVDRATSRTACGRDAGPGRPWRLSSHAGERSPGPTHENSQWQDPTHAIPAMPLARVMTAGAVAHCAPHDRDAAFRPSCVLAARVLSNWSLARLARTD